ncbi:MAG: hypothetical protein PHD82_07655 [Candidatus Riflebacteria bacterium]|nr:hypothetical protein [Candidatus Riflebacteria bacterium]
MKTLNFYLVFSLTVCLAIVLRSKPVFSMLFDTSMPFIVMAALLLSLASDSIKSVFSALKTSLSGRENDQSELVAVHRSLKRFENLLLLCGIVASTGANVACLANIGVPEMIGPCLSISLISALSSVFMAKMLIFPLRMRLKKRINKCSASDEESVAGGLALAGIPFASYLTMVIILYTL